MRSILLPILYVSSHFVHAFPQAKRLGASLKVGDGDPENPDADVEVDYTTGIVDGIPLPGDLASLDFKTTVGRTIAEILELNITAQGGNNVIQPFDIKNPCYKWAIVSIILTDLFLDKKTKLCNDNARAAVRAGFHDAGTWSKELAAKGITNGGADGSLYLFNEAATRKNNRGLEDITQILGNLEKKTQVGVADMIQFAAAHATVTCPLGPRMRTFVGRPDATKPSPDGLLPSVDADADSLIALFKDKGISHLDLVALVGSHTVSKQFFVDAKYAGAAQDSTPGVWDTTFYGDTLNSSATTASSNMFTFNSDKALSQHPSLVNEWNGYVHRQNDWVEHFSRAYIRLSLVGVQGIQGLTECTDALPLSRSRLP